MSASDSSPVRVGIAGLGRSGWNIHAATLTLLPEKYSVVAVSDPDPKRQEEAREKFGCRTYSAVEDLVADSNVELVAVATPSHLHVPHSILALKAGRHVVCEKPFALSVEQADEVIATAKQAGRIIAPFQNRRYDPILLKVREIINSGKLGRLLLFRLTAHNFMRRLDWQTLKRFGGGHLNNWGPHMIDIALQFWPDGKDPRVVCQMERALSAGDAEDHVKVILHGPGAPLLELEFTYACAYPQSAWFVMGTHGGLSSDGKQVSWRWVDPASLSERQASEAPPPDRGYAGNTIETLTYQEETWNVPSRQEHHPERLFYEDLYASVRSGAPLVVTPASVRRQIAVLDQCRKVASETR